MTRQEKKYTRLLKGYPPEVLEKEEPHQQERESWLCWPICKELQNHQVAASGLKNQEAQEVTPTLCGNGVQLTTSKLVLIQK